ncbi:hypothetical protein K438DRAFT_1888312 [Mycena galopus ATCC 62051]|nr:hypothetical protein K438DRAFT_1888312 [Mycena galopus ATCC 62051]
MSEQGQVLANDIREILISYNLLNAHKNHDNLLQEAIWHLTEGDVNTVVDASREGGNKEQVAADINAVRSSLRQILSIFWHNFTDGGFLPTDVVQSQAGRTKDSLREVEQDIQEGQRDSLGRDKQRLGEEQDTRVAFEHTMDTLKDAKTDDISERASGSFGIHITQYACDRVRDRDSDRPFTLDAFIEDPSPEQHIHKALDALKILLDRFANPESSVDDVLEKAQRFISAVRGNSGEFKAWVDKFFEHVHRTRDVGHQLRTRRRELLDPDTEPGRTWAALQEAALTFGAAVAADTDVRRVQAAHMQLGNDMKNAFVEAGTKTALEGPTWFWRDLLTAYAPRILSMLKDIPIPRTEYVDSDIEFVLENLDVSSFAINPSRIFISNTTDVEVRTSETSEATTGVGTFTHVRLQAVQVASRTVLTGLLELTLPPQGIDVEMKLRLIQSTQERKAKRGYYRVEQLQVQIADEVKVKVRQSNHAVMLSLFKPILNKRLREALSRSLAEQFRTVLDGLDGVAWDIGRRAEVFADTGLARGASLAAAVWSEIGHLIRERSLGLHATGTGIVVDSGAQNAPKFAMGAEPQILPGEKHGPIGTGSESLEHRTERASQAVKGQTADTKNQLGGVVGEGMGQVQSFQRSVEEKAAMEKKNPGWKSAAFDI